MSVVSPQDKIYMTKSRSLHLSTRSDINSLTLKLFMSSPSSKSLSMCCLSSSKDDDVLSSFLLSREDEVVCEAVDDDVDMTADGIHVWMPRMSTRLDLKFRDVEHEIGGNLIIIIVDTYPEYS